MADSPDTSPPSNNPEQVLSQLEKIQSLLSRQDVNQAKQLFIPMLGVLANASGDAQAQAAYIAMQLDQIPVAVELFSAALKQDADNLVALEGISAAYLYLKQFNEAFHFLDRILAINPDSLIALSHYSRVLIDLKLFPDAISYIERALKLAPQDPSLLTYLSIALNNTGQPEKALRQIEKAARIAPDTPGIQYFFGSIHGDLGNSAAAITCYEKAISLQPTFGACYYNLSQEKKFTDADRRFIEKTEKVLEHQMSADDRGFIHFALGKMYDDLKQWDKAFEHYRKGNVLRKPFHLLPQPYKQLKQVKKLYLDKKRALAGSGNPSDAPLFIIGMPRSGSTLVEQIISRHPDVGTAGELPFFTLFGESISRNLDKESSDFFTAEYTQKSASEYLKVLSAGRENNKRIIDKSPANFSYIGLILLALPNARFIHTIRHPLDTCLSCYFQAFDQVNWATDLEWIGESYCYYRFAIDMWQNIIPEHRITDIHYENLLEDTEGETRRLIDACGLEWHPDCLSHTATSGESIRTASSWQVRQPIYTTSRMRWVNYAQHLEPLAQKIAPYLSEQDKDIFRQHGIIIKNPGGLSSLLRKCLS